MRTKKGKSYKKHLRVLENIRRRQWHKQIKRKVKKYLPRSITNILLQEMCIAVGYHDLYGVKDNVSQIIKELLTNIPVTAALNYVSILHKQVMYMTTDKQTQYNLTKQFVSTLERKAQENYYSFQKQVSKQRNRGIIITNNISELLLSYYIIQYGNKYSKDIELNVEQQRNLCKAMLCCNDLYTNELIHNNDCNSIVKKFGVEGLEIKLDLPITEYKRDKQIVEPIYKSFAFFKYCEIDWFWAERINKLCQNKKVGCWKEYINTIIGLINTYMLDKKKTILDIREADYIADFMECFCVKSTPTIHKEINMIIPKAIDFLREQFFWKIQEGIFLPLNHNLLINLIYQSIKFDLLNIVKKELDELIKQWEKDGYLLPDLAKHTGKDVLKYIKQTLNSQGTKLSKENEKIIKNSCFIGLNGEFGQTFSQQYILEPLMQLAFDKNAIQLKEKDMERYVEAPSDYYVRIDDALFLFELKDIYLNDEIKYAQDISTVLYGFKKDTKHIEGIMDKICKDGKSGRKGVPQLMNSIVQIINDKKLDTIDPQASSVQHVYPLLITTDTAFSANGVNAFIIKKYREEIRKNYVVNNKVNIHLPTIISIDFFIRYNELLFKHKISLRRALNQYYSSKAYKLTSFDAFTFDLYKKIYNSEACIKHLNINMD